jgi:hypothetical protein
LREGVVLRAVDFKTDTENFADADFTKRERKEVLEEKNQIQIHSRGLLRRTRRARTRNDEEEAGVSRAARGGGRDRGGRCVFETTDYTPAERATEKNTFWFGLSMWGAWGFRELGDGAGGEGRDRGISTPRDV